MNKPVYVVDYKLSPAEVEFFTVVIKDADDITDAIWRARDVARTALNISPFEDVPPVKSVRERGW